MTWNSLALACILLTSGGVLSSCQPASPANRSSPTLPNPVIDIFHQVVPTPIGNFSPGPSDVTNPISSSPQEIAEQTYGESLIRKIIIPAIEVDSPVMPVGWSVDWSDTRTATAEWDSPGPAVGWVLTSALPGQPGNIILYGHNNMYGSVFRDLKKLNPGDSLTLDTGQKSWKYQVERLILLPYKNANQEQQSAYISYIGETAFPRLTLISCWPPESNTYRLVVIANPTETN